MAAKDNPASAEELSERLDVIEGMMIKGAQTRDIIKKCLEDFPLWDVSARTIRWYCQKVKERMAGEAPAIDRRAWLTLSVKRYDYFVGRSAAVQDFKTAITGQDRIVNLLHLDDASYEMDWSEVGEEFGYANREDAYRDWLALMEKAKVDKAGEDDSSEPG